MCILAVESVLGDRAPEWDRLAAAAPLPSPFLRSWWLTAMSGPRSRFLLVLEGDRLLGGLAVDVDRHAGLPVVRPLGADGLAPDHLDLLAVPGREREVQAALRRWLSRPGSRLVDFPGVDEGSRLADLLGPRVTSVEIEQAPWVPLPPDFASFSATVLPGIMRNSIRRSGTKLAKNGEVVFRPLGPDDPALEPTLARLRDLHAAQFGADSGLVRHFTRFAAAAAAGLERNEMKMFPLYVAGEIAAVDVAFSVAGRFIYYSGGRSTAAEHSGAGTVVMARGVEWACSTGHTEADYLRGSEPYKQAWTDRRRPVLRLRAGFGPGGVLAKQALELRENERVRRYGRRVRDVLRRPSEEKRKGSA